MHKINRRYLSRARCFAGAFCAALILTAAPDARAAVTETVLHSFTGPDGSHPRAGLIADSAGNLYGTTLSGGAYGVGAVFKITLGGTETPLYSFTYGNDGGFPEAGLIADSGGNLYGTTFEGGAYGNGVVFKLTPGGTETPLHAFTGGADGSTPYAGLIADSAGNLYGTTAAGGSHGNGVVFKVTPGGTETPLYAFTGGTDGGYPAAGLISDSAGNLYGTTYFGGSYGAGVVFKLTPGGTETPLYTFTGGNDGAYPQAGLIADSAGNLYGTTYDGGANGNGVVFKLTPGGTETPLYSFTGGADGGTPYAGLIADSAGNLYGTADEGGANGNGAVFKLSGTGFVTTVPFSAFQAALGIEFGLAPNTDAFQLVSGFTLGQGSPGINPLTQPVTLQVGTFTTTIPAGSFQAFGPAFYYNGTINGAQLDIGISPTLSNQYAFAAAALKANLSGTSNPATVTLTIGENGGAVSVKAIIVP